MSRRDSHGLLSLIYFHNPFYLISTCLFVYGLKLFFRSGNTAVFFPEGSVGYMEPWGLMAALAAVTWLMAGTATAVVRFGRVWEDARSLVLIVLLMLLAIAVSMDELINVLSDQDNPSQHAYLMLGVGAAFALFTVELLLAGLRVKLGWAFRLPLHALLQTFFLWPLGLVTELTGFSNETTRWLIAAFPLAAAACTLSLLPAVRRGKASVTNNGTPWRWPLFPWTPFVFLGLAVVFRSYALTMSFDPKANGHYWDTIFGLYQLVPFLLAVLVVLLEIGIREAIPGLQKLCLLCAPLLLVLAWPWLVPWSDLPTYSSFVGDFSRQVASPVLLTLTGLTAFFGWAWLRGVKAAEPGVIACGLLLAVCPADAWASRFWQPGVQHLNGLPLLGLGACYLLLAVYSRSSVRFALSVCLVVAGLATINLTWTASLPWRQILLTHGATALIILTGAVFKDTFATFCRELGPSLFVVSLVSGTWHTAHQNLSVAALHFVLMACAALALGFVLQEPAYRVLAAVQAIIAVCVGSAATVYGFVYYRMPAGVKPLVLAVVSFLGAILISTLKGGLDRRLRLLWLQRKRRRG
ncbi:MAG: hypothetical protein NXI04_00415 [Planctomycetaceae bacterium]|nr:hypothetical protein [Planctomycetaceae bacterium]